MNYYVYILANKTNTTVYVGVTDDLMRRLQEHRNDMIDGFTKTYHVHKLVYYESFSDVQYAIAREKQLKGWRRARKDELIESVNPTWEDLAGDWFTAGPKPRERASVS